MDFNLQILVWLFVLPVVAVRARYYGDDIECLKSIKESFEDPQKPLFSTWRFDDLTEGAICKFERVTCWNSDSNRISELSLSSMGLVGSFPRGLGNCSSLTSLDLSHNHLFGQLPSDMSRLLGFLVTLDLSNNSFSGGIPVNFSNCTYLNYVNLDSNQLQGRIPSELGGLTRLKTFSVANNHLSGPVPDFLGVRVTTEMYANNSGLCGGPLPPCIEESNDEDGVEKIKFIGGFAVGWVISALVTWFLGLFYLPNTCSSWRRHP